MWTLITITLTASALLSIGFNDTAAQTTLPDIKDQETTPAQRYTPVINIVPGEQPGTACVMDRPSSKKDAT